MNGITLKNFDHPKFGVNALNSIIYNSPCNLFPLKKKKKNLKKNSHLTDAWLTLGNQKSLL
jgi:hypothetical protein